MEREAGGAGRGQTMWGLKAQISPSCHPLERSLEGESQSDIPLFKNPL